MSTSTAPVRARPRPHASAPDLSWYVGGTALAFGLLLFLLATIPADAKSLSVDDFKDVRRFQQVIVQPLVDPDAANPEWLDRKSREAGNRGKAHAGPSGKMGSPKSKNKEGLVGLKGPKENSDPHLARELAEEAAKKAGMVGIFRKTQPSHIASIFGRDSALGRDTVSALGGLIGAEHSEAYGVPGGLGLVGDKKGGGGTGEGTFGPGTLGTIGKCAGEGCGPGSGPGYWRRGPAIDRVTRPAAVPEPVAGQVKTRGKLDKEIIRRVIRSHIKEVKFCYESELVRRPDLYGRVTVQFTITPQGIVSASAVEQSTLGSPAVERCIAQAVRRWVFPQPEDGGVVLVSYPFVLQAPAGR